MVSKDGEEVPFKTPVKVADAGVKEWLTEIEGEMRRTLALLLGEAVGATGDLANTSRDDAQVYFHSRDFHRTCGMDFQHVYVHGGLWS